MLISIGLFLLFAASLPTLISLFWVKRIVKEVGVMPYILYCLFGASAILMTILTYVLAPFLALYSVLADKKNLPMPFYLLQTHDNDLDGGQKDLGWPVTDSKVTLWKQRMAWLMRNPAYGWSALVLGIKKDDYDQVLTEDSFVNENSDARLEFTIFQHKTKNRKRFGIRWHPVWGKKFYVKYWIGWNHYAYGGVYHQVKTMANPFKKRKHK